MSETLLKYAEKFLSSNVSPEAFSHAFAMLWKIERDERITIKDPRALKHCLSAINSVSEAFDTEAYRLDPVLSDLTFRNSVTNHIEAYKINKRNKKYEDIAFELELLYRRTNSDTGAVTLVSKVYVILRNNIEQAKRDAVKILHDKIQNDAVFSNEHGHIIHESPVEVVSVKKSGSLGADWMIETAMHEFGYKVGDVNHLLPDDLPPVPAHRKNEKIIYKLELLFRWTNTETASVELVSKVYVILRNSLEDAKQEAIELLGAAEPFRNKNGVIIKEEPVEVVSVQSMGTLGSAWLIESAVAEYGFEAGVVKHRPPD